MELGVELNFRDTPQVFFQNRGLDLKLMFVTGVLVVAAATALKVRATRRNAFWRSSQYLRCLGAHEPGLLLEQDSFDLLALQDER